MALRAKPSPARPFEGEASFAKVDDYIDGLVSLHVGGPAAVAVPFPRSACDAALFEEVAHALATAEAIFLAQSTDPAPLWFLPLFALGSASQKLHPLNWLGVDERHKNFNEKRSNHDWCLSLSEEGVVLHFTHGELGYRRELHDRWSSAFSRLSELMAGRCSWRQFGGTESRNTLLGKGQFYWEDLKEKRTVPVDNFVFRAQDGREFAIHGVSHRCLLDVTDGESNTFEWYEDYAEGLLRLADVLEGSVDMAAFGEIVSPELHASAPGRKAGSTPGLRSLVPGGQFVVKCIYAADDVLHAPVLSFKTAEGRQAVLAVKDGVWRVRVCNARRHWRTQKFTEAQAPEALRVWARVLKGTLRWRDF